MQSDESENIGQRLEEFSTVQQITLDSLHLDRLDLLKVDVEMEFETLAGAKQTISQHTPQMLIEAIKINGDKMRHLLDDWGYTFTRWTAIFTRCIEPIPWRQSVRLLMAT